jgi:glycosyltransferase involved in cell wall biosynthesis
LSEEVLRPYLPAEAQLYRIPNPINLQQQEPVEPAQNVPFIALGRLSAEKGFGLLATAAASIDCKVIFVGEGPERVKIKSLNPGAEITGWQPQSVVEKHLRSARALILPSLWYEAQPLSVLEAAAVGIPAVVPDSSAARELVEDGVTGLWFRGGDAADLAQKMAMLRDDASVARMGQNAYQRYWKNPHTLQRHVELLENCYLSVLRGHRGVIKTQ